MSRQARKHYAAEALRVLLQQWLDGERMDKAAVMRATRDYDDAVHTERAILGG